jgi:hypothetical protein
VLLANLEQIDEAALQQLCTDKCPESGSLDFKREPPGNSDKEKNELLKDVCALANADGGDLVYGIAEADGAAGSIVPITGESADAAKRRIAQVLDAGLDPRVHGIKAHHVDVTGGYVLIIRVPGSYDGPHSLRVNGNLRRFVMRNGTSTSDLTFDQIRAAFDRSSTLAERAQAFIKRRLDGLVQNEGSKPLKSGPRAVVHLVPIAGLAGRHSLNLRTLTPLQMGRFMGGDWGISSSGFNLDGLVFHPGRGADPEFYCYAQLFRTAAFEAATLAGGEVPTAPGKSAQVVWATDLVKFFRQNVDSYLTSAAEWSLSGPVVASFSLLHVDGYSLGTDQFYRTSVLPKADRKHLVLPNAWIEDIAVAALDDVLRPQMDVMWQAFGMERCHEFDAKTGEYQPARR